jgi:DNA-directed RNA polymerase alpha subunit
MPAVWHDTFQAAEGHGRRNLMSSTQLDHFAAAALTGLLSRGEYEDVHELAREAFRIARAMMAERVKQTELPDSNTLAVDVLAEPLELLELPLRINKKLRALGIERVRDLTLTTEKAVLNTGLREESLNEIIEALHRHGLRLAN